MEGSVLDHLGADILGIISPVSLCMLLVVLLVHALVPHGGTAPAASIAMLVYDEQESDSFSEKLGGALLNALVFVAIVTVVTFVLVALFYYRCTRFLKGYMGFSAFMVLAYMGGGVAALLIQKFNIPVDIFTFSFLLYNFATVGVMAVFFCKMPLVFTQGYLVLIGMLVAYWFTMLPEWTTWILLVAMALYDVFAVLLPGGPLNILVELAIARDEDIPALVYEARPVTCQSAPVSNSADTVSSRAGNPQAVRRPARWRRRPVAAAAPSDRVSSTGNSTELGVAPVGQPRMNRDYTELPVSEFGHNHDARVVPSSEDENGLPASTLPVSSSLETLPLVNARPQAFPPTQSVLTVDAMEAGTRRGMNVNMDEILDDVVGDEGVLSGAIKLGLGDFIFYSVLVGRAAMYDMMTVYACYLAIVAGLGATLVLLAAWRRALPALPISIALGVLFYLVTRLILGPFVVNLATNCVLF